MRHTRHTHTRENVSRERWQMQTECGTHSQSTDVTQIWSTTNERYMNKLPASRAGEKRHFRRYLSSAAASGGTGGGHLAAHWRAHWAARCCLGAAGGSSRRGEAVAEASLDVRALAHGLSHLGLRLVGARARSRATVERELATHTSLPPSPSFPLLPLACPL